MKKLHNPFLVLLFIGLPFTLFAQEPSQAITVSGSSVYNLSPDEIIIRISFQEYFTNSAETLESKISITVVEKEVRTSLTAAAIVEDKITAGEIAFIQPNRNNQYKKPRLNKTLYVCVANTEEFMRLINQLEKDALLNDRITYFSIIEYRHTEKEKYLKQSKAAAFTDAKEKATLILGASARKLGRVINIKEVNQNSGGTGSFYGVDNAGSGATSGFKPVVVSYALEVTFEIL